MNCLKYLFSLSLFCMFSLSSRAQITDAIEQNCIGGIPVCQGVYTQVNAYSGDGTITELNNTNQGCLSSAEKNDVWYIITVTGSGTLSFTIAPANMSDDYDWGLWDITGGGCSMIYNYNSNTPLPYLPIRCNYSGTPGLTGMTPTGVNPSEGAGGIPFSTTLTVTAGQTFALNVSNYSSSQSGYVLDFTSSTATYFDTVKPVFSSVAVSCSSSDSLIVTMSKPVQCSSLDADGSNLYITPAGSTNIIASVSPQCQAGGNSTTTFSMKLSTPLPIGTYALHAQNGGDGNTLLSACGVAQSTDDSVLFTIQSAPNTFITPNNPTMCANGSVQLTAGVNNPDPNVTYTYSWTPTTNIDDPTSSHPVVSPQTTTNYTVTVLANGVAVCGSSATTTVHVLQGFNLPTKDTSICNGASFQIRVDGDAGYTYTWSPATWLSDPNIMSPVTTPQSNITYTLTASYPGCADSSQSIHVAVGITPIITATPDTTTCLNNPLQLNVDIQNPNPAYAIAWTPVIGITGQNTANPVVMPPTTTAYVVTVTDMSNEKHCAAFDTVNVTVLQSIQLANHDTAICKGASVQLNVTGDPRYTYGWSPTTSLSDPNALSTTATPDTSITYSITATYPGCNDQVLSVNIDVQPNPVVSAGPDLAKCQWDTVIMRGEVSPEYPYYTYTWTPDNKIIAPSSVIRPVFYGDSTTTLHFIVTTPAGCKGEDSAVVTVWPGRYGTVSNDTAICPGFSAPLLATGGVSYSWSPSFGLSNTNIPDPIANPDVTTTYTVYMLDTHNCADTNQVTVTVHPGAVLNMPDSVIIYPGESYHIQPQTNCVNFSWFPPLGLSAVNVSDPIASPLVNTRYKVDASTEYGCALTDSIDVYADPTSLLTLPNAFTPGNGPNNVFKVIKRGIATLQTFRIYDRWGTMVFQTTNIDEGWDGTYNGTPQPSGVYVYMAEATSSSGQHFVKNGNVTLLR